MAINPAQYAQYYQGINPGVSYTGGSNSFNESGQQPAPQQAPVQQPTAPVVQAPQQQAQPQPAPIEMTPGGAQPGLSNYLNSPGAALQFGSGVGQAANNGMYNPTSAFYGSGNYNTMYGPSAGMGFFNSPNYGAAIGQNANSFQNSGQYQSTYGMPGAMGFLNSPNFIANNGGLFNPNQGIPGSTQSFFNSPQYAAMYGSQAAQNNGQAAASGTYDPTKAFQQDPGFQYNMDQALRQVNNSSAARGLLESGQTQRDLLTTAQGLQNQGYQNWLGQQNQLFGNYQNNLNSQLNNYQNNVNNQYQNQQQMYAGQLNNYQGNVGSQYNNYQNQLTSGFNNYQNQLAQLSAMGPTVNGSNLMNQNSQTLANLLNNNFMTAGQGQSQNITGAGNNISQLLAQLGYNLSGMQQNTAAAQANNLFQGNAFQAQIDNEIMNGQSNQNQGLFNNAGNQSAINQYGSLLNGGGGASSYTGNPMAPFGGVM